MPDVSGFGPILTLLGTFAGVWVVVILFRWFQRDFAATYRAELVEERTKREEAEERADRERDRRYQAELVINRLRRILALNGLQDPTASALPPPPTEE